jgi:hypothetical protein
MLFPIQLAFPIQLSFPVSGKYDGESVNRSQTDIKRKTCDIRTWKKHLFFDISSTNIDNTCPHRFTSASEPSAWKSSDCCLSHFHTSVSSSSPSAKRLSPSYEPLYATDTSHRKQEKKNRTTQRCSSLVYPSSTVAILTTETSLWTCSCASAT